MIPRRTEQTSATSAFIETGLWESRRVHEGSEILLCGDVNARASKPMERGFAAIGKAKPGFRCKVTFQPQSQHRHAGDGWVACELPGDH